ncbi:MAG: hypothetical protein SNI45_01395 [Rikenellaceae bacterium]
MAYQFEAQGFSKILFERRILHGNHAADSSLQLKQIITDVRNKTNTKSQLLDD